MKPRPIAVSPSCVESAATLGAARPVRGSGQAPG